MLKTKSYLKFSYGTISARSNVIDALHSKSSTADVKIDSIIRYFKVLNPDKYYYQLYNRIPLRIDKMDTIKRNEVQTVKPTNKDDRKDSYDFVIKTMDSDMFLVISNQNGERVAVIK